MEFVAGADFVEHVRRDASTTSHDESILQRFVNAAPQLVEALAAVHAAGRLHRDVKPANVRVTPQGRVVLLDFDLAARLADGQARDTLSGSFAGTYAYMAPEQAWGRPLSAAADWYATGVLFHEVLTGRLPVEGPPAEVLLAKSSTPPHIRAVAPWVPEWLDDLVANMLHPVADRRPGADEIVDRFARASPRPRPAVASVRRTQVGLVGRVKELAQLRELVDGAVAGEPTICIIEGASGIGKTALTEHFLAEIERDPGFVILRGRCHPGESVP